MDTLRMGVLGALVSPPSSSLELHSVRSPVIIFDSLTGNRRRRRRNDVGERLRLSIWKSGLLGGPVTLPDPVHKTDLTTTVSYSYIWYRHRPLIPSKYQGDLDLVVGHFDWLAKGSAQS